MQKKIASTVTALASKQAKLAEQRQQAETASEEIPDAEGKVSEQQEEMKGAESTMETMKRSLQCEVRCRQVVGSLLDQSMQE
jgi:uncharacterized phage infection (PIP) family protein YhgE